MPTMRVTWEAKHQLQQILCNAGFPEETMAPLAMETVGPDPRMDVIMALMCYGLYPNVCWHKEKRKVINNVYKKILFIWASQYSKKNLQRIAQTLRE